ncbi:MAG: transporter [Acidobacteriota bacterium]
MLTPVPSMAQDVPLSQLLVQLIQADIRLEPPAPGSGFPSHEAHFLPGADQTLAPYLFNQQLVGQLATVPIGSPTGGFAFTFDAASGTFQRTSDSFGPAFADRALTNGRGKLTFGTNFQYSKYSSFEGQKLEDGAIKFYLTHQDLPGDLFFEGDLIETSLRADISSATTTFFGNYGVTDKLDLAIAVPLVSVHMDATVDATILRLASGQDTTTLHFFAGGSATKSFTSSGGATGIGDMLVRAKYRFISKPGGGFAAGIDLRLPTGDADNLLGAGAAGATFTAIGSTTRGKFGPHFNLGYTTNGDSDIVNLPNEFNYRFGSEFVATPRMTLNADLLGRTLLDAGRLELTSVEHHFHNAAGVAGSKTFEEYAARSGSLNLLDLAVGGKFNIRGNFLLNANVLFALNDAGVIARVTPVIGFDYTF